MLAHAFIERFARGLKRPVKDIDPDAIEALVAHAWPGNIRELENVIERCVLFSEQPTISLQDLPPELLVQRVDDTSSGKAPPLRERVRSETRRIERAVIVEALQMTNGNITKAARRLGISRRGLQLKIKELEIDRRTG